MWTRRDVLRLGLAGSIVGAGWPIGCTTPRRESGGVVLNDVHAQLNATRVRRVERPTSTDALVDLLRRAARRGQPISVAGARHAMGGQQFGRDTWHVDTSALDRVRSFDPDRRLIEVEPGIRWPRLMAELAARQQGREPTLGIVQKQTGADELSLGGALAANIHGRGLTFAPFVQDVESLRLLDAGGRERRYSRSENAELFRLAVGGYGLAGIVTAITLRLQRRVKLRRLVQIVDAPQVMPIFERRIAEGCLYGDFQYSTDPQSDGFLTRGVLTCYAPVTDATPMPDDQVRLSPRDWQELIYLAHVDRREAYRRYTAHYRRTDAQIYWSDTHQLSTYLPDYHALVDRRTRSPVKATEMISELYVPRDALAGFLRDAAAQLRDSPTPVIYGTVRLIERDDETLLAWARRPWACVIFNLHCVHTATGLESARRAFRSLIDLAIRYEGSYYLTYHRWATRAQVERCHPRLVEFLRLKRAYDPEERFQSEWYRHYRAMFVNRLGRSTS